LVTVVYAYLPSGVIARAAAVDGEVLTEETSLSLPVLAPLYSLTTPFLEVLVTTRT
jgi:hypothetical protein